MQGSRKEEVGKVWRVKGMEDLRSANFLSFHVDGSEAEWRHLRARNESCDVEEQERVQGARCRVHGRKRLGRCGGLRYGGLEER